MNTLYLLLFSIYSWYTSLLFRASNQPRSQTQRQQQQQQQPQQQQQQIDSFDSLLDNVYDQVGLVRKISVTKNV